MLPSAGASGVVAGGTVLSEELSLQPAIAKNDKAAIDVIKIFFIDGSPSIKSTYACQQREPTPRPFLRPTWGAEPVLIANIIHETMTAPKSSLN